MADGQCPSLPLGASRYHKLLIFLPIGHVVAWKKASRLLSMATVAPLFFSLGLPL